MGPCPNAICAPHKLNQLFLFFPKSPLHFDHFHRCRRPQASHRLLRLRPSYWILPPFQDVHTRSTPSTTCQGSHPWCSASINPPSDTLGPPCWPISVGVLTTLHPGACPAKSKFPLVTWAELRGRYDILPFFPVSQAHDPNPCFRTRTVIGHLIQFAGT